MTYQEMKKRGMTPRERMDKAFPGPFIEYMRRLKQSLRDPRLRDEITVIDKASIIEKYHQIYLQEQYPLGVPPSLCLLIHDAHRKGRIPSRYEYYALSPSLSIL